MTLGKRVTVTSGARVAERSVDGVWPKWTMGGKGREI